MVLSVDVGGTFTDFVLIDEGMKHFKVPTTPENPEKAVGEGVEGLGGLEEVFHGSTIATNAFLEREGADTAFITNSGFEELLFIGRQTRPQLYNLKFKKPNPPLVRENCFGLNCRLDENGRVVEEIRESEVEEIAKEINERGLAAAVCLFYSFKKPEHEKKVGEILDNHDIQYSLSSEVSPEFREYERGMTTLMDTYLTPLVREYMEEVSGIVGVEPYIMKSGGGLERASTVDPVDTLFSGPAGGVVGGEYISKISGSENLITFDMGGTSADMAAIVEGERSWKTEGEIGEFPIQAKMIDITTVGSGGGSIAWVDSGGALRVGPKSAGAEPGPVCYGKGGEKPTVTDALLHLGYLDPNYFLGGEMELAVDESREALENLTEKLDMNFDETLLGIFRVANSKMARTMKKITVRKGLDPRDFSILAFGGAGPLHAAFLAEELEIEQFLVPPLAGVFSALGMVTGNICEDHSVSLLCYVDEEERIEEAIDKLRKETKLEGEERVMLGLRYEGQSYHINIPYEGDFRNKFHKEHKRKYGFSNPESPIEVVRVHLEVERERKVEEMSYEKEGEIQPYKKRCKFPGGEFKTKFYKRENLPIGMEEDGPAVIVDKTSTCLVPPGWSFKINHVGTIEIEKESASEGNTNEVKWF